MSDQSTIGRNLYSNALSISIIGEELPRAHNGETIALSATSLDLQGVLRNVCRLCKCRFYQEFNHTRVMRDEIRAKLGYAWGDFSVMHFDPHGERPREQILAIIIAKIYYYQVSLIIGDK